MAKTKNNQEGMLSLESNPDMDQAFDSKKMLKENGAAGTKIKFTDRMKVEYIKGTQFVKAGTIIAESKVKALALISQGIAKKYVEDDED
jgi:hypothetical protein